MKPDNNHYLRKRKINGTFKEPRDRTGIEIPPKPEGVLWCGLKGKDWPLCTTGCYASDNCPSFIKNRKGGTKDGSKRSK